MQLTGESIVVYQGISNVHGCCHVRVFEQRGHLPVVVAGKPDDSPGTILQMAIEMAGAAIQRELLADGREFRLVQYEPPDRFLWVDFAHRSLQNSPDDPSHFTGASSSSAPIEPRSR